MTRLSCVPARAPCISLKPTPAESVQLKAARCVTLSTATVCVYTHTHTHTHTHLLVPVQALQEKVRPLAKAATMVPAVSVRADPWVGMTAFARNLGSLVQVSRKWPFCDARLNELQHRVLHPVLQSCL